MEKIPRITIWLQHYEFTTLIFRNLLHQLLLLTPSVAVLLCFVYRCWRLSAGSLFVSV